MAEIERNWKTFTLSCAAFTWDMYLTS